MTTTAPTKTRIALALLAAWLGWGFDVFDAHLISYVARPTIKALLHDRSPTPEDVNATLALLTSLFLFGWAAGGIIFGRVADRLGRSRTMLLTMILYGVGTAACAMCDSVSSFALCRVVASLGIGGEWAAGASLVAEIAPDKFRPLFGALLYTASPLGQMVVSEVNHRLVEGLCADDPANGWRWAFALGIAPAAVAFVLRAVVSEPARWQEHRREPAPLGELFAPALRRRTIAGLALATFALIGAWSILNFIPQLGARACERAGLKGAELAAAVARGNLWFLCGGTLGTLATVLVARFGRRSAFAVYLAGSFAAIELAFGLDLSLDARLASFFFVGFAAHGVFGLFPFYLPELFPTRLRGTGAGFCYNTGRIASAVGVFFVGDLQRALGLENAVRSMAFVYLIGLAVVPFAIETRGEMLSE